MANHHRLYSRPLGFDGSLSELQISGALDGYVAGEAYESTLDIINFRTKCRVEVLESDLPAGYTVRVDNVAHKIIVRWPAYSTGSSEDHSVANGDFDDGSAGWELGAGWGISTTYGYNSNTSAIFADTKTTSESVGTKVPASPGDVINLGVMVQQGASSKRKAGGQCFLRWYGADNSVLRTDYSTYIESGKKGAWQEVRISTTAPGGTTGVSPGIRAYRKSGNDSLWIDHVNWDHQYISGQLGDDTFHLSIKLTDPENRVAYWSGTIEEFTLYFTSNMYPLDPSTDELVVGGFVAELRVYQSSADDGDPITSMGRMQSGDVIVDNRPVSQDGGFELITAGGSMLSGVVVVDQRFVTQSAGFEEATALGQMQSGVVTVEQRFVTYAADAEAVNALGKMQSGSLI